MDIFILPSGSEHADSLKTVKSFEEHDIKFMWKQVRNLQDIIESDLTGNWYMIMYDDEHIDENMAKAIPVYLLSQFDVLECYKKTTDKTGTLSPRLFRGNVRPQWDTLLPADIQNLKSTRILDGWIKPHVQAGH